NFGSLKFFYGAEFAVPQAKKCAGRVKALRSFKETKECAPYRRVVASAIPNPLILANAASAPFPTRGAAARTRASAQTRNSRFTMAAIGSAVSGATAIASSHSIALGDH